MELFRSVGNLHMLPIMLGGKDCRPRTPPNEVPAPPVVPRKNSIPITFLGQTYDRDMPGRNWETLTGGEAAEGFKLHVFFGVYLRFGLIIDIVLYHDVTTISRDDRVS